MPDQFTPLGRRDVVPESTRLNRQIQMAEAQRMQAAQIAALDAELRARGQDIQREISGTADSRQAHELSMKGNFDQNRLHDIERAKLNPGYLQAGLNRDQYRDERQDGALTREFRDRMLREILGGSAGGAAPMGGPARPQGGMGAGGAVQVHGQPMPPPPSAQAPSQGGGMGFQMDDRVRQAIAMGIISPDLGKTFLSQPTDEERQREIKRQRLQDITAIAALLPEDVRQEFILKGAGEFLGGMSLPGGAPAGGPPSGASDGGPPAGGRTGNPMIDAGLDVIDRKKDDKRYEGDQEQQKLLQDVRKTRERTDELGYGGTPLLAGVKAIGNTAMAFGRGVGLNDKRYIGDYEAADAKRYMEQADKLAETMADQNKIPLRDAMYQIYSQIDSELGTDLNHPNLKPLYERIMSVAAAKYQGR